MKIRLAYLSGPVDAVDVYEKWTNSQKLAYFGDSHMRQFFEICSNLSCEAYVITTLPGAPVRHQKGGILFENRPIPAQFTSILYHLANACWLIRLLPGVLRFKPDVFIATAGQNYWFLLTILKWRGVAIIPVLVSALWPKFAPLRLSWRILRGLNKIFFTRCARAIVAASDDIAVQVRSLTRGKAPPVTVFLPVYRREQFSGLHPASFHARPFKAFFAGRIETNKGVYDLVAMAQWLEQREPGIFHFDICGEGSELEALRRRIELLGLTKIISCHGFCNRSRLSELLNESSVVIVPTRANLEEGFNMVCAEAILAGRPLVTSAACPALRYVKDAAIEVPPDNLQDYCQAIWNLAHDMDLYERKRLACKSAQEQFFDPKNSWGAKLTEVIARNLSR